MIRKTVMQRTGRVFPGIVHDLIFESLKREDEVLTALAMEALVAMGTKTVHVLVVEATTSDQIKYQVRLLQAIAEIGELPNVSDYYNLTTLTRHSDPGVREAVARVMFAIGPQGPKRQAEVQSAEMP
jgi:predicted amidohydrolase YtcJ